MEASWIQRNERNWGREEAAFTGWAKMRQLDGLHCPFHGLLDY